MLQCVKNIHLLQIFCSLWVIWQKYQYWSCLTLVSIISGIDTSKSRIEMVAILVRLQCVILMGLTHWGRVRHICISKLNFIGSDSGLPPGRHQAIIWSNAGILLIRTLGTNVSEISIKIHIFSFKKMHFKMSSGKWRSFCLGLNMLTQEVLQYLTIYFTYIEKGCLISQNLWTHLNTQNNW